jgi:hypothetical protein
MDGTFSPMTLRYTESWPRWKSFSAYTKCQANSRALRAFRTAVFWHTKVGPPSVKYRMSNGNFLLDEPRRFG